ncbi:MAG: alkyl sulfatase dimerization domain-containing protein [Promethearchaeota archaeon]
MQKDLENSKKVEPIQVIAGRFQVEFHNPHKDISTAKLPIAGCGWVKTIDGVVIIDTLISRTAAREVYKRIKEGSGNNKIKYIIYTHGHLDHVQGAEAFLADSPEIIASKYLPARLDNYKMLAQHRNRIAAQQFNLPETKITKEIQNKLNWIYPTKTFLGEMTISLGGKTFELHTARAETDDVCWVYVPELKAAFIGDLLIGSFPNIGNPWKPTRFALDWAKTLEKVREKEPELLFYSGAGNIAKGKEKILNLLDAHIEVIRSLHDQVVEYINQDIHISEMIHLVKIPDHLKNNPHLRSAYSRVEFFVYNVYRWYHGYFDGNPAHLLPEPEKIVNKEVLNLIGDSDKIIKRVNALLSDNKAQLALQILDILIQAKPENIDARKLRIKLLTRLGQEDACLMSRNTWVYYINKDKKFLSSKGIQI